jgi:hypothetical protein
MYTHDQVIITVSDDTGLCSWVYVVGHACLIVCQVISAPTLMAVMVAVLSQRVEVPEGDGRMPSRVSWVMPPTWFNHRAMRSIRRVIYEMVINFLSKQSPLP